MRLAVLLAVLLTGCFRGPVVEAPTSTQDDVAVVTALKHTFMTESPACTMVDIGGGRVLTAKHCAERFGIGGQTDGGVVTYLSPNRDFAVLVDSKRVKNPVPSMRPPVLGEHIYTLGYPVQVVDDTRQLTVTDGVVTGAVHDGELRITAPIWGGNSGGGAWAEDGSLVGITVSGIRGIPSNNYMVSAEDILEEI